ncbi:hypothetical protein BASA83_005665 [Batrachochytrium salamandrivorans]|nr:hypothetical protein BASA83_005665 [Batrachochytrium salamandrivorans]
MDSSHSDYYRQTSSYHSNLDVLAASATSDGVDCLKCPTALLQLCDIALDDGPLRPVWPPKGADTEHFSMSIPLISNTVPAPSADTAAMATAASAATTKRRAISAKPKKAASTKRGGSSTAPTSNVVNSSKEGDASLLTGKRTHKDGKPPTQRKKTRKVIALPVVEKLASPKEEEDKVEEDKEEEDARMSAVDKQIGSTSAVRRPYRASKKPANTLATAGDTMPTEDELKAMAYIASSLRVVPHSSELFASYSTRLTCLPGSNSTMERTEKEKDESMGLLLTLNGVGARSLDFYMDAVESKQFTSASQFWVTLLMDLRTIEAALGADGEAEDHLRRTLGKLFKLFGSLWEFYFPLVDISQGSNSGRRSCNGRSDLGLTLMVPVVVASTSVAAASSSPSSSSSSSSLPVLISATVATPAAGSRPARLKNKRAAAEFTDSDKTVAAAAAAVSAAPKRLCNS